MKPVLWKSYAYAAAVVAAATAFRLFIGIIDQQALVYAVFYPAVLISALWFGTGPGIFAAVLSLVVGWTVFAPTFGIGVDPVHTVVNLSLFGLCSGLIIWVADAHRRALQKVTDEEEMRQLLVSEMRHRSRNTLTVARSIIDRTLRDDPDKAKTLYTRMRILIDTEGLFEQARPDGEPLDRILLAELEPHGASRFSLSGAPVRLASAQSRGLALVAHELVTNAVKYGALAIPGGFIRILWTVGEGELALDWVENGCAAPFEEGGVGSGFGTRLIEIVIAKLGGTVKRDVNGGGLTCRVILPLTAARDDHVEKQPPPAREAKVAAQH
jgi:two-component sensor histidine kinase